MADHAGLTFECLEGGLYDWLDAALTAQTTPEEVRAAQTEGAQLTQCEHTHALTLTPATVSSPLRRRRTASSRRWRPATSRGCAPRRGQCR